MSRWAQDERQALVGVLRDVGPDAPTACGDWNAAQLAAHLYVREHRVDAMPGVAVSGPLAGYTDRVMASVLRVHDFDHLLDRIAAGPPLPLRPFDEGINLFEYFVHHEDVRRRNGGGPRELPAEMEQLMWRRLRRMLRPALRRADGIQVEVVAGPEWRTVVGTGPTVRVLGDVGEIVLLAFNRKDIADVELSGDAGAVGTLREARLGL